MGGLGVVGSFYGDRGMQGVSDGYIYQLSLSFFSPSFRKADSFFS